MKPLIIVVLMFSFSTVLVQGCAKRFTRSIRFSPSKEEQLVIDPCHGLDFCEDPAGYPHKQVLDLLKESKNVLLSMMFTKKNEALELLAIETRQRSIAASLTTPQFGSKSTYHHNQVNEEGPTSSDFVIDPRKLCETNSTWIRPRLAKNYKGVMRYIVNSPSGHEEYSQYVKVTQCYRSGEVCDPSGSIINSHIRTKCRQEYTEMKLIALGADMRSVEVDTFRFPSCCSCYIISSIDL